MDARCSNHSALKCAWIDCRLFDRYGWQSACSPRPGPFLLSSYLSELAQRGLDLACLTGNRLRLARFVATAVRNFLPLPAAPPFLAKQESSVRPSSISLRSLRAHPIAQAQRGPRGDAHRSFPVSSTAIEAAMGAARNIEKE